MVSDQEISRCVDSLLRRPDGATRGGATAATASDVVRQVEERFGVDLSHKAAFIQDQIDLLRGPPPNNHHPPPPAAAALGGPLPAGEMQQQNQQFLLQPFYQFPPGSYPFAFRFPQPTPGGTGAGTASAAVVQLPIHLQQQQLQQLQQPVQSVAVQQSSSGTGSRTSVPARIKRKRGPGGLTRICGVSPELQAIVGEPAMPRTQIVKQLWAYIRKNNLQDPNNKRKIICNDELRLVLETDSTDIFKMNKLLAKHIIQLEPSKNAGQDSKKLKVEDVAEPELELEPEPEPNAGPGPCPLALSDALVDFLGTGETELLQSEALNRIRDYVKDNQLEDPVNSMIYCDLKLQQLFGCESLAASEVPEILACHLFEKS